MLKCAIADQARVRALAGFQLESLCRGLSKEPIHIASRCCKGSPAAPLTASSGPVGEEADRDIDETEMPDEGPLGRPAVQAGTSEIHIALEIGLTRCGVDQAEGTVVEFSVDDEPTRRTVCWSMLMGHHGFVPIGNRAVESELPLERNYV